LQPSAGQPYLGLRIAYLPRNSTPRQDGNMSQRRQRYVIADHIAAGGGTPVPYDEGIASGRDLGKRPDAMRALADLQAGTVDALAWEHLDRATRDEHGTDAGIIAEALIKRRALLVTLRRDYRLWLTPDLREYRRETGDAGVELLVIRDRLWGGVLEKATDTPFFMGVPPFGYLTRPEKTRARRGGRRARYTTVPAKDEEVAPVMRALAAAMDGCAVLGEVAFTLNAQGHYRTAVRGELAGEAVRWKVQDLRRILENPVYEGLWTLGRHSDGTSPIWEASPRATASYGTADTAGGRINCLEVPHLAWFSREQLADWRAKYPADTGHQGARQRKHVHPLRGVLACAACGRAMVSWGDGGYGCPHASGRYAAEGCPKPQRITEQGAVRALVAELPNAVAAVKRFRQDLAAHLADDDELDALRRKRDMRVKQCEALAAQTYHDEWDGTPVPAVESRLKSWQAEADDLSAKIARREQVLSNNPERGALAEAITSNAGAVALRFAPAHRMALLRLVFADARILVDGYGPNRTYRVGTYTNLLVAKGGSDGRACTTSVYRTIARALEVP
jgi:Resolvase, N terminal domain